MNVSCIKELIRYMIMFHSLLLVLLETQRQNEVREFSNPPLLRNIVESPEKSHVVTFAISKTAC